MLRVGETGDERYKDFMYIRVLNVKLLLKLIMELREKSILEKMIHTKKKTVVDTTTVILRSDSLQMKALAKEKKEAKR